MRIGVDTGGTFTDFAVLHESGEIETFKLRSNPRAPHAVILAGLARFPGAEVVHGSTVATNALLERKGARTVFVTTAGFEDILEIGRQNRASLYDLTPPPKRLLVDPKDCFGIEERVYASGAVALRPTKASLTRLRRKIEALGARSVAICLLHSYLEPSNEERVAAELGDQWYLSVSHDVCPEFREYERGATTAVNAYVGPLMQSYVAQLGANVSIMQSNGGTITRAEAARHAVRTILSGPAGGAVGAAAVAAASGYTKLIGFDMGGTSTDVCLCDGRVRETTEAYVDGLPIKMPMLEIHTVGAGGGSLARVDPGGLLRVGPESAGADPGPACYGKGSEPAVTDAHVVLGRIAEDQFLGGAMRIDAARAAGAVAKVAARLKLSVMETAAGILRVANANIERAIRVVSVERGHDPRDFALLAFGGCGGLHACEIAEAMEIRTVIAPAHAGALSAYGMLLADRVRDFASGVLGRAGHLRTFNALITQAGAAMPGCRIERYADMRYRGQSYELTVPWRQRHPERVFHQAHQAAYGYHNPDREVEVVTLRVRARVRLKPPRKTEAPATRAGVPALRKFYSASEWVTAPALSREQVSFRPKRGPALLIDYGSTTIIPQGWRFHRDNANNILIRRA